MPRMPALLALVLNAVSATLASAQVPVSSTNPHFAAGHADLDHLPILAGQPLANRGGRGRPDNGRDGQSQNGIAKQGHGTPLKPRSAEEWPQNSRSDLYAA